MAMTFVFQAVLGAAIFLAAAAAATGATTSAPDTEKGKWVDFTDTFNNTTSNGTSAKFGKKDNFRAALAVDPGTGHLFVSRHFTGVWMSRDRARSFVRVDGGTLGGVAGPFSCYSMVVSPDGGKLAVFNFNNGPGASGYSLDGGRTWQAFASVGRNWDYGALDWDSRTLLALRHENTGVHLSIDMGKTWSQLDLNRTDLTGAGVFSAAELVVSGRQGIRRSKDAGKTWAAVATQPCTGTVHKYKGVGYWPCNRLDQGTRTWSAVLLATDDKGKTWRELGAPLADTMFCSGPFFGRNQKHMVMATMREIVESLDGGATWRKAAAYPPDIPTFDDQRNGCAFPTLAYDAAGDVFYVFFANIRNYRDNRLYTYAR